MDISAIILAAGESQRMGEPKLILPWGGTTVLGQVVMTFSKAGITDILVVTGGARQQVEDLVKQLAVKFPVRTIHNPDFEKSEMLGSIQVGLNGLNTDPSAALIGLGDQPQIQEKTIRNICSVFSHTKSPLVIPSFQGHRGHPWLVARPLWAEILAFPSGIATARRFLNAHTSQIKYVQADDNVLKDLDTLDEYKRSRP